MAGPADEARVTYKALANFLALHKAVLGAKKDLLDLKKQEAATNASSVAGSKKTAAAYRDSTKALKEKTNSTRSATTAILNHNKALNDNLSLTKSTGTAAQAAAAKIKTSADTVKDATTQHKKLGDAKKAVVFVDEALGKAESAVSSEIKKSDSAFSKVVAKITAAKRALVGYNTTAKQSVPISARTTNGIKSVINVLNKVGSVRSHGNISAPFLILIPVIGALLALLNPLVAILGAVGAAGFGAGAGVLSLGGAALAIIPMVSAAAAAVGGLLVAFRGVGSVFSAYSAAQKATGGGGGGGGGGGISAADQAYNLAKAEQNLADAQQNAKDAQKNLNDARVQAVKDLKALKDAVTHDVLSEADATATLQQATEAYYNTLADPGSTLGDKEAALANLHDAQQGVTDAQQQAADDQDALTKAQKAGINGDQNVIAAQKELKSALQSVADAQHALNDQVNGGGSGGGGGGVGAMDAFNAALKKLSPSAQKFVLGIIAMQGAWNKLQRTVQEAFFSKIVGDLGRLRSFLPTLTILLASAAGAMGDFAHNLILLITSTGFKGDLLIISKQNVQLIDLAGQSILNLIGAMKDLIIAAGPFAVKLLGSFQRLTKSFAHIVSNARQTGSLAKWLDVVYGRLQQWWRIIKNVASTLFNYGAASASFGQWITNGLENSTKTWLKASEDARKKGSPFQTWLEQLKPLERQIKGLFGDFFSWLSKTAHDNDAIAQATNIISDIRTKLGPAVAKVFDSLSESGLGDTLVQTLSSIADSIAEIIKNGGAQGLKNFFSIIEKFFSAVAAFSATPVGGWFISNFVPAMGVLAGLTFVGKFTGLFTLFGWLLKLAKSATVLKLLTGLKSLGGLNNLGRIASSAAAGGAESSVLGGAAEGAAGTLLGVGAGTAGAFFAIAIASGFASKAAGDALASTIEAAATKAANGKPTPKGHQTPANLGNQAKVGTSWMYALGDNANFAPVIANNPKNDATGLKGAGDEATKALSVFFSGLGAAFEHGWTQITTWFSGVWGGLVKAGANGWTQITTWFSGVWSGLLTAGKNGWAQILTWWSGLWGGLLTAGKNGWSQISSWWNGLWGGLKAAAVHGWSQISSWWNGLWGGLAAAAKHGWSQVSSWWNGVWGGLKSTAVRGWGGVTSWWSSIWGGLKGTAIKGWSGISSWFSGIWGGVLKSLKSGWSGVSSWFSSILSLLPGGSGAIGGYASKDKASYLSDGGPVRSLGDSRFNMDPKGTDTKPAMLTPGEYVVQKKRVDEVGPANMQAFNDGVIGFAALLSKTKGAKNTQPVFSGSGLAGKPINTSAISSSVKASTMAGTRIDSSSTIGQITIINPTPEPATVSLPSALRKAAQTTGRRKPTPRLTGVQS